MSEILIKGLKIKDYPQTITINPDGSVIKDTFGLHRLVEEWKAIEVPTHGDLVDRDFIIENGLSLREAPTVIEASTDDTEGRKK